MVLITFVLLYRIYRIFFLDFFHRPVFQKTRRFGNLICFRPQVKVGEKTPTQVGPLERANLNHWTIVVFFGIQDDGKSPEKFCEFCTTYTIVRILSSLFVLLLSALTRADVYRADA
jgi:hypothetical protein